LGAQGNFPLAGSAHWTRPRVVRPFGAPGVAAGRGGLSSAAGGGKAGEVNGQ
jgi:hypothetical protein